MNAPSGLDRLLPELDHGHLDWLEEEAIFILREAVASFERPALLFSGGKDSCVVLRLAEKAFKRRSADGSFDGRLPFPLLHVDTGHNFPEVIAFRDRRVADSGDRLVVGHLDDSIRRGTVRLAHPLESRNGHQTVALLEAIEEHRFDLLLGGARRDEEKARAKERIFSHRDSFGQWLPKEQRPELWTLFNTRIRPGEHMRAFPISNWTELDVWLYIARESIPLPSLYYAHDRQVIRRRGLLVPLTEVTPAAPGETVEQVQVRFRTVGDMTCTCPVESDARTPVEVVGETLRVTVSERGATRMDDRASEASMERRKKRGLLLMDAPIQPLADAIAAAPGATGVRALRFLTAGSVDDGKSTLIGRLLFDSRAILADQLDTLEQRAARSGGSGADAGGPAFDLALLTDGLEAEREQGITIDVAYRYFATRRRKFIIADAPGHEQYTRNMVTAAAGSDAAVVLVDITKLDTTGQAQVRLLPQTRRHALLARLLRVPSIVFAINKLDAVDDPERACARVREALLGFADEAGIVPAAIVPVSALRGDNVTQPPSAPGAAQPAWRGWYAGPSLLQVLEALPTVGESTAGALLLPVQYVAREADAAIGAVGDRPRTFWGRIARGSVRAGDAVEVFPSGEQAVVTEVRLADISVETAEAGQSAGLVLDRQLDISRGDWLATPATVRGRQRFAATLAWLDTEPAVAGRRYLLRHGHRWVQARIGRIENRLDIQSLATAEAGQLAVNEIGRVLIETQQPLPVEPYADNRVGGALIVVDSSSHRTSGALLVEAD